MQKQNPREEACALEPVAAIAFMCRSVGADSIISIGLSFSLNKDHSLHLPQLRKNRDISPSSSHVDLFALPCNQRANQ